MKVRIVGQQLGEVSYTPKSPVGTLVSGPEADGSFVFQPFAWNSERIEANIEDTDSCLYSSDDFRLIDVKRYEIREVELPDWLDSADWGRNHVKWKYFWACHKKAVELPEHWQRKLVFMDGSIYYALAQLLCADLARMRSSFRKSVRSQVEAWLNADYPEHLHPLSNRQTQAIAGGYTFRNWERLSQSLYSDRRNWT